MEDTAIRRGFDGLKPGGDTTGSISCPVPLPGGLAGGNQRHKTVFGAVSADAEHRAVMTPTQALLYSAKRNCRLCENPLLYTGAGLRRLYGFRAKTAEPFGG
jgi:hypothetical protein